MISQTEGRGEREVKGICEKSMSLNYISSEKSVSNGSSRGAGKSNNKDGEKTLLLSSDDEFQ